MEGKKADPDPIFALPNRSSFPATATADRQKIGRFVQVGDGEEVRILSEEDAAQLSRPVKKGWIFELGAPVLVGG